MVKLALAIALVVGLGVASCTLFDDAPPDGSCEMDTDCFRAQGEVCNQMTHECEVRADAGVDAP